jgi:hypothetical protein
MNEAEKRQKTAKALLEYTESKQSVTLLRKEARDMSNELDAFATLLREHPERIDNPTGSIPTYREAFELSARIRKAKIDLAEREDIVKQLGLV